MFLQNNPVYDNMLSNIEIVVVVFFFFVQNKALQSVLGGYHTQNNDVDQVR